MKFMRTSLILMTLCWAATSWAQSTFKWVDEAGEAHYTDDPSSAPNGVQVEQTDGEDISTIESAFPDGSEPEFSDDNQQAIIDEQQGQISSTEEFVPALQPYGDWVEVEGQRAWRPSVTVVGANFVPYSTGGRWALTSAGWVWQTDWPWGWAAFHYGRWWQSAGYGWVWYPDVRWAPAWVSWRYGGGYTSWSPLFPQHVRVDPYWCTVRNEHFLSRRISSYALPNHHAAVSAHFRTAVTTPYGPPHRAFASAGIQIPRASLRANTFHPQGVRQAPPPPRSSGFGFPSNSQRVPAPPPPSSNHFGSSPNAGFRGATPQQSGPHLRAPPPPNNSGFRSAPPQSAPNFGAPNNPSFRAAPPPQSFRAAPPPPSNSGVRVAPPQQTFRAAPQPSAPSLRAAPPPQQNFRAAPSNPGLRAAPPPPSHNGNSMRSGGPPPHRSPRAGNFGHR